jgi:hypothetical protein
MALQESIDRLLTGCAARGWTIDEFLALPGTEIVDFAQALRIPPADLRDICGLLMQQLESLDFELPERPSSTPDLGCRSRFD